MPEFPSNYYLSAARLDDKKYSEFKGFEGDGDIELKEFKNTTNKTVDIIHVIG